MGMLILTLKGVEIMDHGYQASAWHAVGPKQKATIIIPIIPLRVTQGKNEILAAAGEYRLPWDCLLRALPVSSQALSQSHPSGIQPHTQLQLPEWLSRHAASLLTEVRCSQPRGGGFLA